MQIERDAEDCGLQKCQVLHKRPRIVRAGVLSLISTIPLVFPGSAEPGHSLQDIHLTPSSPRGV
jgi:hypothetical protein